MSVPAPVWPTEQEPYDGEHCQDCGRSYVTVYHVPDDVWRRISPRGDEGGLLCPVCAEIRAYALGIDLWWQADVGRYPANPQKHHGHLRSFPPYVGGDDDDIEGWQAECCGCGFRGRETPYLSVAYGELVTHLNEALAY